MQGISFKQRTTSTASSNSSVTEYVNEIFTRSELELSKDITIHVTKDMQGIENPLAEHADELGDSKTDTKLRNFSDSSNLQISGGFPSTKFRKMYFAALSVLMFAVCMGMTGTYSATATENMKKTHSSIQPTKDDVSWIGSLMAAGALMGGTAAGYFTGSLGRKGTLMFNTILFVTGWLFIAYAPTLPWIFAGRVITGFCIGVVSVATPMYLVEISTPEVRGLLGASFQLFVVIGILIISGLGSFLTWRYTAVSGAVTTLLAAFLMLPMPESPWWLMSQKRRGEAKNAIKFLQGESFDVEAECRRMEKEINNAPKGSIKLIEFKAPTLYKPFLLSISLMFFQQFSGVNAFLAYTVDIFGSAGSSGDPVVQTIIVSVVQVVATLLSSVLMDRAGRKPLLMISGVCMAVSLIIFGGFDLALTKNEAVAKTFGWLPLVCLMTFIAAFSIGFGPTPWLMVAEMTPSRFVSIVSGVSTAFNWTFVFIITKTFSSITQAIHYYGGYWLYAVFCIGSVFVTYFLLPETKGKTSEEIEEFFIIKKRGSTINSVNIIGKA